MEAQKETIGLEKDKVYIIKVLQCNVSQEKMRAMGEGLAYHGIKFIICPVRDMNDITIQQDYKQLIIKELEGMKKKMPLYDYGDGGEEECEIFNQALSEAIEKVKGI